MGTRRLPGVENGKHDDIAAQAEKYVKRRDQMTKATREFKTEKDELIRLMTAAGLDSYHDEEGQFTVVKESKDNVKVKADDEED